MSAALDIKALAGGSIVTKRGEIELYGVIAADGEGIAAEDFISALNSTRSNPVVVRINSPGGSVEEGLAIYSALMADPREVHVFIDGLAGSIASVVALAGDQRIIAHGAKFMTHRPWADVRGDADLMREMADAIDAAEARMVDVYAERLGMSREAVATFLAKETWLDPLDAIAMGFATVMGAPVRVAACAALDSKVLARLNGLSHSDQAASRPHTAAEAAPSDRNVNMTTNVQAAGANAGSAVAAIEAERKRASEITALAARARVDGSVAERLIAEGASVEKARDEILEHMIVASGPETIPSVRVMADGGDRTIMGITRALDARLGNGGERNEFSAMPLAMMAEAHERAMGRGSYLGTSRGGPGTIDRLFASASPYASRVMAGGQTTSDFPNLLLNALNKTLDASYERAMSEVVNTCFRASDVADFRPAYFMRMGEVGQPVLTLESAEIRTITVPDSSKESVTAATYTGRLDISRQSLINDNLGGLNDLAANIGMSAACCVNDNAIAIMNANTGAGSNLADGNPVFYSGRSNIAGSGAAITIANIGTGVAAIRGHKGIDGVSVLNLRPKYLVCGAAYETTAKQIMAQINSVIATRSEVNPWENDMTLVVDARITGNHWYLLPDPMIAPIFQITYLQGQRFPVVQQQDSWSTLGTSLRVWVDFGVGPVGWRGSWFNAGA